MFQKHVWNWEPDRKLHIRRTVPTYQGEEQIPEKIVPLLRQFGFYWITKMGYLKINTTLISALIERWKSETHTFHLRCGEAIITLQDASILLGLRTDGTPLIGSTNFDWTDLCEELLRVRLSPHCLQVRLSVIWLLIRSSSFTTLPSSSSFCDLTPHTAFKFVFLWSNS